MRSPRTKIDQQQCTLPMERQNASQLSIASQERQPALEYCRPTFVSLARTIYSIWISPLRPDFLDTAESSFELFVPQQPPRPSSSALLAFPARHHAFFPIFFVFFSSPLTLFPLKTENAPITPNHPLPHQTYPIFFIASSHAFSTSGKSSGVTRLRIDECSTLLRNARRKQN